MISVDLDLALIQHSCTVKEWTCRHYGLTYYCVKKGILTTRRLYFSDPAC